MTEAVRWGFIATGSIAATVADDLEHAPGAHRLAVASRDVSRALDFAAKHGFDRAYGSYAELLADPDVDAVYLATPHAQHYAVARQAIAAGKPLLVEKAFTCTQAAGTDLVLRARAAGIFVMEAMWMRFQPAWAAARAAVADGMIGEVRAVHADLGFVNDRGQPRLVDPRTGGGVLLDCGVYLVSLSQWLLGAPTSVQAVGTIGPTCVDVEAGVLLQFEGGAHAVLSASFTSSSPGAATIVGTQGHIRVEPRLHRPAAIHITRRNGDTTTLPGAMAGRGYSYQFTHVAQCLAEGRTESPVMPLDDTLSVLGTLDRALHDLGVPSRDEGFPAVS